MRRPTWSCSHRLSLGRSRWNQRSCRLPHPPSYESWMMKRYTSVTVLFATCMCSSVKVFVILIVVHHQTRLLSIVYPIFPSLPPSHPLRAVGGDLSKQKFKCPTIREGEIPHPSLCLRSNYVGIWSSQMSNSPPYGGTCFVQNQIESPTLLHILPQGWGGGGMQLNETIKLGRFF